MSHHTNWQCSGSFQSKLFLQEKGCGAVVGHAVVVLRIHGATLQTQQHKLMTDLGAPAAEDKKVR
jgi:hypothetical protein